MMFTASGRQRSWMMLANKTKQSVNTRINRGENLFSENVHKIKCSEDLETLTVSNDAQ